MRTGLHSSVPPNGAPIMGPPLWGVVVAATTVGGLAARPPTVAATVAHPHPEWGMSLQMPHV